MPTTGERQPTLAERVTARLDSLTATERRVARYLADHPQQAAFASAEELGKATGTSDASVVRTAKALGFDGLPELKRSLQGVLGELLAPANRLHNTLHEAGDRPEAILAATLADRIALIEDIRRALDPGAFAKAVDLVAGARETLVCGIAGLVVAEWAAVRLVRMGRRARFVGDIGVRLVDQLLPLGPDDVVFAIAPHRLVKEMRVVIEYAHRVGAKVVLLTETLGEALRDEADVTLSVPFGQPDRYGGQTTTLVVLEAITLAVAAQDEERSLHTFTTMTALRRELDPNDQVVAPSADTGPARTTTRSRRRR
ncbi:MAG TPA: MurR/RpiR family transcriptional regulator [Pseudonocardiaceae bacterium]|nr:MurR/RpiR family transcriptional regulator [Pseudonocardiaceae bacterium]